MFGQGKEVSFWFELLGGLKQIGEGGYNCSVWQEKELSFVLNYWEVQKIGGKIIVFGKKRKSIYCRVIIGRFEKSGVKLQCLMQVFPLSCPCQFQKKQTNKTVSWFDSSVSGSGRFFLFFPLFFVHFL